jgi:hypothetical protein
MNSRIKLLTCGAFTAVAIITSSHANTVYDNLSTSPTAGYSEANANNPIYGDSLSLSQGGHLTMFGLSLFNSSSGGNTGSILAGTTQVRFYDNTSGYSGGSLAALPLLGTATVNWSFGGGLLPGFYATDSFDLTGLNIILPQNILVTQQFTETSGTSTRNGVVLFGNPAVGSSPPTVYINSSATAEGLYVFANNPNQFGYSVEVAESSVPEGGATALLLALALGGLGLVRNNLSLERAERV